MNFFAGGAANADSPCSITDGEAQLLGPVEEVCG